MKKETLKLFSKEFLEANMMGPNSMIIMEELIEYLELKPGMRVLDLGCGKGLTSLFLAQEFGVTVFAADLWISATENYERVKAFHLTDKIIPIHCDAHNLPFANEFFDVVVSVDAYHYFGVTEDYMPKYLAPLVKPGGQIAIAVPGLKTEFNDGVPTELLPYWQEDFNFHSCAWWKEIWSHCDTISVTVCTEMKCWATAWSDWLLCDNEHAKTDIAMMEAEGGKHYNLVAMIANKL